MDNVWVAAGFNSIGIRSAGGVGMVLAQWMDTGAQPFDLGEMNITRNAPFQSNKRYLFERVKESLGLLYADHYPYRQKHTARGVRRTPFHQHLVDKHHAVMGEINGWERANWFATDQQQQKEGYKCTWKRQNFFENVAAEVRAMRTGVGVYDMSSFGKIRVEGQDAERFLNYVCGNDVSVPVGRVVYTQFLNHEGGIEADVTVTRLEKNAYLVVTPAATRLADETWMRRLVQPSDHVVLTDVTAGEGVLALMGPKAREVMQSLAPDTDFGNDAFPFGTAQPIELGMGMARAHRITYVGELGWEIYISSDMAAYAFEVLCEAGQVHGLKQVGMHAVDCARTEKGYRHFGHDITCEDHVLEAGLGFAVKTGKAAEFIGKDAVLEKKKAGLESRMVQFRLVDPEPLLYHNEPIVRDGDVVGYLSSGTYGHYLGGAVGLGYVPCKGETAKKMLASSYEIDIAGVKFAAEASLKPMYDAKSERPKS
jgi:4-methylaminobutanoate oxidase (formaldehyde-forming)